MAIANPIKFDISPPQYYMCGASDGEFFEVQPYRKSITVFGCSYCGNKSGWQDERGNCVSCGAPLESEDND